MKKNNKKVNQDNIVDLIYIVATLSLMGGFLHQVLKHL